jgi:phosphate transport system permease protein
MSSGLTQRKQQRKFQDRAAAVVVSAGGSLILFSIIAIFFVIVAEVRPLFRRPKLTPLYALSTPDGERAILCGLDDFRENGFVVTDTSRLLFADLREQRLRAVKECVPRADARITAAASADNKRHVLGTADGRAILLNLSFDLSYPTGHRIVTPRCSYADPIDLGIDGRRAVQKIARADTENSSLIAAADSGELVLYRETAVKALLGPSRSKVDRLSVSTKLRDITALALSSDGRMLAAGDNLGRILLFAIDPSLQAKELAEASVDQAVTALDFLLGNQKIISGLNGGEVVSWLMLREKEGTVLREADRYRPLSGTVTALSHSPRNRTFAAGADNGRIILGYGTSGETLLDFSPTPPGGASAAPIEAVMFAPKGNGLAVAAAGRTSFWGLENPHPEVSWKTLFGRVWYEGYNEPAYVWQSTGATDEFEPKISLTPLIFGTLKGTFYALIFAVPLAVLGALYASQFLHPAYKNVIKPVIELMAALPSVVIGFIAALWLAPYLERIGPGAALIPVFAVAAVGIAFAVKPLLDRRTTWLHRPGSELVLILPALAFAIWAAIEAGFAVEERWLGGDYLAWLREHARILYDQRNAVVVGIAMGFAVVPIIFTIAEDCLASVPRHLIAGSLALGATRWQTAYRVVLPVAAPGIFSAIMIGLGRAVGETMIVLMATGNTAIMDGSPFNGFRALSANIAVELPEAPVGGTLYRVLFLSALVLFVMTFAFNTVSEVVRMRLRRNYKRL